jgi:hypothetical protein
MDFARALSEHKSGDSRSPASVTTKPRTIPPSSMPSGQLDARIAEPLQRRTPSTPRWLIAAAVLTVILIAGVLLLTTRPWEIRESTTTTTTSNVVPSEPAIATTQRPPTTTVTSSTPVATATTATPEPVPTFQTALPLCYDSIPIAEKPSSGGLLCKGHWFENMTWNSWGPDAADGAGIEALKGCTPSCATGELSRYPVEVHFSGPAPPPTDSNRPSEVRYYTQLIVAYPTSPPPPFPEYDGGPVAEKYNGVPSYRWNGLSPHCY